jgi:hypothetical protein
MRKMYEDSLEVEVRWMKEVVLRMKEDEGSESVEGNVPSHSEQCRSTIRQLFAEYHEQSKCRRTLCHVQGRRESVDVKRMKKLQLKKAADLLNIRRCT